MADEFAFPQPGPDWSKPIIGPVNGSNANPGDIVFYNSGGSHVEMFANSGRTIGHSAASLREWHAAADLLDTDKAEGQAAKLTQLLQIEPPAELLARLDPVYVGEIELVRIVGAEEIDYAIELTTTRGKTRVHRTPGMTWEETLIRAGLLDGP
jgi:cell wall-associated NlpC family hydrolase